MITFDNVDRNYEIASKTFSLNIPEIFNFGFDVLDVRAQEAILRTARRRPGPL